MKPFPRYALTAFAAAALIFSTGTLAAQAPAKGQGAQATKPKPKPVNKNDASYVVGWDMASSLPDYVRSELNPDVVAQALRDAIAGKKSKFSKQQSDDIRRAFVSQVRAKLKVEYQREAAKNKRESAAFLAANKKKAGVKVTSSGLQYEVIKRGTGAHPGPQDTVQVEYVGNLVNGTVFDQTKDGKPVSIPLSNVIPGFREGLELMQVGGHYKLFIPPEQGYGERPSRGFPPNAALIFDVKLLKTTPPAPDNGSGSGGDN